MQILSLDRVVKNYRDKKAVDEVSFDVPDDKIFGLLGPNGAGKTSLIRIITKITNADSGTVHFQERPMTRNDIQYIGYLPEERGLYKKMKVGEQLLYLAQIKGMDKTEAKKALEAQMEKFDIISWWNKKIEELSKGMQQKVQFISTIIHKPRLLILDEPFSGLDPINTDLIKNEIKSLSEKGCSIIFSTHRMEQVEEICEKIVLINNGANVLEGNVEEIKEEFKDNLFKIEYSGSINDAKIPMIESIKLKDSHAFIKIDPTSKGSDLLGQLVNSGIEIKSFQEVLPSLNEIFIKSVTAQ